MNSTKLKLEKGEMKFKAFVGDSKAGENFSEEDLFLFRLIKHTTLTLLLLILTQLK